LIIYPTLSSWNTLPDRGSSRRFLFDDMRLRRHRGEFWKQAMLRPSGVGNRSGSQYPDNPHLSKRNP